MIKEFAKEFPTRVKAYTRENWGVPFIIGFMLLLVLVAFSLSMGLNFFANEMVVYAYCAFVGVVLQLVCFVKYEKKGGDEV
jgi:heme/copper-type cytochrome/quinol oxidase subunit 4